MTTGWGITNLLAKNQGQVSQKKMGRLFRPQEECEVCDE